VNPRIQDEHPPKEWVQFSVKIDHEQVCREISGELKEMASLLAGGGLSPEQFRLGLTRLEEQHLKHAGLKLRSSVSEDGVVHFCLRFADTEDLCANIDVDPMSGEVVIQSCPVSPKTSS
jgi:hypothetical protein